MITEQMRDMLQLVETLNKEYPIPLNESLSNYDYDELLESFDEGNQKFLLSLPELPLGYMIHQYNFRQDLKKRGIV